MLGQRGEHGGGLVLAGDQEQRALTGDEVAYAISQLSTTAVLQLPE